MDRKIYLWGTGNLAEYVNAKYENEIGMLPIVGYIDNNPEKVGSLYKGKIVYSPTVLRKERECNIIILIYNDIEVKQQIKKEYPWLEDKIDNYNYFEKIKLLNRYNTSNDKEELEIVNYLYKHPLQVFNYPFTEDYDKQEIKVYYDSVIDLYYVIHENKKMYFSRQYRDEKKVKDYYRSLLVEQDIESPHRYLTETYNIREGDIVVDGGVAEGNFALSIIDKVKKVYLFEPDVDWIEALNYTFAEYREKVVIVNKALSNYTAADTVELDKIIQERTINFLKLDIEGEEYYALEGAGRLLADSNDVKCLICSYHQEFAYHAIKQILEQYGFKTEHSKGFMWYPDNSYFRLPVLRRGLIRAHKGDQQ